MIQHIVLILAGMAIALCLGALLFKNSLFCSPGTPIVFHNRNSKSSGLGLAATTSNMTFAACTMVKNEVPYLLEWIEFHRLQGLRHFWIFDDRSVDNVSLLETLYKNKLGNDSGVEIYKASGGQNGAWAACLQMGLKRNTTWVIVFDIDEFWHSPIFDNITHVFDQFNETVGAVTVQQFRFGTSGQKDRFHYKIDPNGTLHNPHGIELLTESHVHRGPYAPFGEPAELISKSHANCSIPTGGWYMCYTGIRDIKSAWRPHAVQKAGTHGPELKPGYVGVYANITEIRGFHYYYKSLEDSRKKTTDWGKADPLQGVMRVESYWNSIYDISMWQFVPRLKKAIANLMSRKRR